MPPKRKPSTRGSAKKKAPARPAPPSSEDAKPNVAQLNADFEAEAKLQAEPPSSPPQPSSEPELKSNPLENPQSDIQPDLQPDSQSDPQPAPPSDSQPDPQTALQPKSNTASTTNGTATGSAPPPRRLDSLGPSGARGKKPVAAPRFAGRRSQAKRDELEKAKEEQKRREDEAKAAEELAKARSDRARSERGRGRGRGRGAYRGQSQRADPVPSGPFSAGQLSKETQQLNKRWSSRGSGSKGLRPGSSEGRSEKKANTRAGRAAASKTGDGETKPKLDANGDISMEDSTVEDRYASSDDEEIGGQRRMDVEKLGVIDLTQDEPGSNAFVPIRIARVPHKERGFATKIEQSVKKEDAAVKVDEIEGDDITTTSNPKEKQKPRDVEVVAETHDFVAVYSDSESDAKPKLQTRSESDVENAQDESSPPTVDKTPSSPESKLKSKGKGKEKANPRTLSTNSIEEYDEEIELDREEEERRRQDLDLVRTELGKADADGDAVMLDAEAGTQRSDKVYLFQFPPILPDLEPIVVKPDPDAINEDGDIMQLDQPSNANKPITINDEPQIKLPSGAVGKMKVHASGRVTMDWGGMSLCLGAGARADFLQTVVATTLPDQKDDPTGSASIEEGQAINLGRIKEKFVVTPNWEELFC